MKRKSSFPKKRHSRRDAYQKSKQHGKEVGKTHQGKKQNDWPEPDEVQINDADDQSHTET